MKYGKANLIEMNNVVSIAEGAKQRNIWPSDGAKTDEAKRFQKHSQIKGFLLSGSMCAGYFPTMRHCLCLAEHSWIQLSLGYGTKCVMIVITRIIVPNVSVTSQNGESRNFMLWAN